MLHNMMKTIFICIFLCHHSIVSAFAPNAFGQSRSQSRLLATRMPQSGSGGVSSSLISQLAVVALKSRLKGQTQVACDVTMSPSDLLRGKVGPVTVKGRSWQSSLNLTCRVIEATVDACELDFGRILSTQKIVLTTPANGKALIAMTGQDFGNFITHPLLQPPRLSGEESDQLRFVKGGSRIDSSSGAVIFFGEYNGDKWQFILKRGTTPKDATVIAEPVPKTQSLNGQIDTTTALASQLGKQVSEFFNSLEFELDGTFLQFDDMMVTSKGSEASVMLSLAIRVVKFPSAGVKF